MKKLMKFVGTNTAFMYLLATKAFADSSAWTAGDFKVEGTAGDAAANQIMDKIMGYIQPIAAILIFASVLMIGFEIIMKRNKADDRMASMSSLMWVGIGTLVIAFAALIASMLYTK